MKISIDKFGVTPQGKQVDLITFENESGAYIKVTSYGAKLVSLVIPDKNGKLADVVLGYNDLESYLNGERFFGSNPGPFANRIKDASFTIDGQTYHLTPNEGANLLHSGSSAIEAEVWSYEVENDAVTFSCSIPDGKYGFPGGINISICYKWSNDLKLSLDYRATTSKPTHINLTHHSYFNLNGDDCDTILDHIVSIDASSYLETDNNSVPTGNILPVANTPLDLREAKVIGDGIFSEYEPMQKCKGYDHCYVIDKKEEGLSHCARVLDPKSGRTMDVYCTLPGVQFYTDNYENGVLPGKHGKVYPKRSAFCLEPQFYPNSPNIESFPSTLLRPGREYNQTIVYQFNLKH
jgi:aldose 1-epimerase